MKVRVHWLILQRTLRRYHRPLLIALIIAVFYAFSLPEPLFDDPVCVVLEAADGQLLGARIAADGQWRFPFSSEVPEKFTKAIIEFEDRRFYRHPGFDPLALGRACFQNIRNGRIVSGGSTLSMQVIRLSRKGRQRTVLEKFIELILATRLEIRYTKPEILALYASHAPFGGNIVGLDAASWRYFGKEPSLLSWAEAATLAVLPNSPALIHPGRNQDRLLEKRNRLLRRLYERNLIDQHTFELSVEELLPEQPYPLPRSAPHLLERVVQGRSRKEGDLPRVRTTIQSHLQHKLNEIATRHITTLKHNEIHNLAILVLEVKTQNVVAYIGNAPGTGAQHGEYVDVIAAPRSTGSTLKPLLYALMLQEGYILPQSLIADVPVRLGNFTPTNFYNTFDGVVPARMALARSLNVPFVKMLQQYGVEKFHFHLKKLGITTLNRSPDHYGLSLILGGAEASLWDLTTIYCSMARTLSDFYLNNGKYEVEPFRPQLIISKEPVPKREKKLSENPVHLDAGVIWLTFEAMEELDRPTDEGDWQRFESGRAIAWKTGTSFGFRDGWSIGVTPNYVVGVWIGNADGEGRPGLTGIQTAAPLMFEVFRQLPAVRWFDKPYDALRKVVICRKSGFLALDICEKDTVYGTPNSQNLPACPWHREIFLSENGQYQVSDRCAPPFSMRKTPWFVLPPLEEYYYKAKNPTYLPLPPFQPGCQPETETATLPMQLIYPRGFSKIYLPVELDGQHGKTVFKAAHRHPSAHIHWHLDQNYIATTTNFHEISLHPSPGHHRLVLVDDKGYRIEQDFEILSK